MERVRAERVECCEGEVVRLSDGELLQNGVASLGGNLVLTRPFTQTEGKTHDTLSGGISRSGAIQLVE
jgi:hypothetical protein